MKDLWDSVLKRLSHELSETTINTWFDEVTVVTTVSYTHLTLPTIRLV